MTLVYLRLLSAYFYRYTTNMTDEHLLFARTRHHKVGGAKKLRVKGQNYNLRCVKNPKEFDCVLHYKFISISDDVDIELPLHWVLYSFLFRVAL